MRLATFRLGPALLPRRFLGVPEAILRINDGLRDESEFFIRGLFLVQCLLENLDDLVMPERNGPGGQGAVGGDLVMLGFLGGGDQGGIAFIFLDQLLRFLDEAFHPFTPFAAGLLFERAEDMTKTLDLVSSLALVLLESSTQSLVLRSFGHFWQRFQQLQLGIQQIL